MSHSLQSKNGSISSGSVNRISQLSYDEEKQEHELSEKSLQNERRITTAPLSFPEGGSRAWLTVLGGCMVTLCTFGVVQSFGVYQDHYTRFILTEHTPSKISWIGSMQAFLVFAIGLPAGKLFEMGYFRSLLLVGSLLYLFSIFMLSLAQPHHYYQFFLAQGIGAGIGMGILFVPSLSVTAHYFRKKRSLAMGIVIVGAGLGGCIYPIMLNNIFARTSFGWGVRAVAFLDAGLLIIANLIMKTRLPPSNKQGRKSCVREIMTDMPYLLYMFGTFLVFWGAFVPFFYLQLWGSFHNLSTDFNKYTITIMNGSSIVGRIVPNLLADRFGPLNAMIVLSCLTGALVFAMLGATNVGGITAFAIFYGFFSGGTISVTTPAVSSFITRDDASDLPLRIAILSFTLSLPLLTGNPIAGALLTSHRLWHRPLIFAAVVLLAGTICYTISWKLLVRRKGTKYI